MDVQKSLRVLMVPRLSAFGKSESGIRRVIENYVKYQKYARIKIVDCDPNDTDRYDVLAIHAGTYTSFPKKPILSVLHGLYWTADYDADDWEWKANRDVINVIRHADHITVPSNWVAETIRRDLHYEPDIIPHGIEIEKWTYTESKENFVLWNKNRTGDVCSTYPLGMLARMAKDVLFLSTFLPREPEFSNLRNIRQIGLMSHDKMKAYIQSCGIYLSTTKETFGIGILEAMASGTPILGFNYGGNAELVKHGVNGYLAEPNDYQDLLVGLRYCMENRKILGANSRSLAAEWTWQSSAEKFGNACRVAYEKGSRSPTVSIIIPTYNYADKVGRAIDSAREQDYEHIDNIIVVDDGSTDDGATERIVQDVAKIDSRVLYIKQSNAGVAVARNTGIASSQSKYVCCLDADDRIKPEFIRACVDALETDKSLGVAYTGLWYIKPDGEEGLSPWPGEFDYSAQLKRRNQIPTCCVFRRDLWERVGGYRRRYAPEGAGSEDAEFWTRLGARGAGAKKVTDAGLFVYSWLSGRVSGSKEYQEVDWLYWHPFAHDDQHPFASMAKTRHYFSHPVKQYDIPYVSIVVPVGKNHVREEILWNALDSLEGQTLRDWEVIVVWDGVEHDNPEVVRTIKAFPFIKSVWLPGLGAGAARNAGARVAKAPFLLFLDADDWLYPQALERMVNAFKVQKAVIYSDYDGKAFIEESDLSKIRDYRSRLLAYNRKTGEAVIKHNSHEYECERAQAQPDGSNPYIWCLVSALLPRAWHNEIGGFDEGMESWEDWDYWIRMAQAGKCFVRIPESLVVYRFYTGDRREQGITLYKNLLKYLKGKHSGAKRMPCNCGGRRNIQNPVVSTSRSTTLTARTNGGNIRMDDQDMILVTYRSPNMGQHKVVGQATKIHYGYRGGGEQFLVHRRDVEVSPHLYEPVATREVVEDIPLVRKETPPPVAVKESVEEVKEAYDPQDQWISEQEKFDLQTLPGVSNEIAQEMNASGIFTPEDIVKLGLTKLQAFKGVGKARARSIFEGAKRYIDSQSAEEDES